MCALMSFLLAPTFLISILSDNLELRLLSRVVITGLSTLGFYRCIPILVGSHHMDLNCAGGPITGVGIVS